jgi:hypothetical protein
MTVPPGFRRMAAIPDVLRLHDARLIARDVQTIDGVRLTTPLRTLVDVIAAAAIASELQVQAVDQALRRGSVMRRQLETRRVSTRARQRIDRNLKQVPDGTPVAIPTCLTNSPCVTSRIIRTETMGREQEIEVGAAVVRPASG